MPIIIIMIIIRRLADVILELVSSLWLKHRWWLVMRVSTLCSEKICTVSLLRFVHNHILCCNTCCNVHIQDSSSSFSTGCSGKLSSPRYEKTVSKRYQKMRRMKDIRDVRETLMLHHIFCHMTHEDSLTLATTNMSFSFVLNGITNKIPQW